MCLAQGPGKPEVLESLFPQEASTMADEKATPALCTLQKPCTAKMFQLPCLLASPLSW